ncbi:MAG: WecB/TagA/CpsF family glycosyltransferase [Phycisphaerales bacterium]|nr:MAG: WecB/TagA/CpsF family glycosyltransferase [Phycisphaerales bacterium]
MTATDNRGAIPRQPPVPLRRIEIAGIPFDVVNFQETLDLIIGLAKGGRTSYVVTPNVDHVVRTYRAPELRSLYTSADLVVADGTPLIWASRLLGKPLPERVAGSDLFPALCAKAADNDLSVFLLGGAPGTADQAAAILQQRHPRLKVAGTYCPPFGFEEDADESARILSRIKEAKPAILFVGLGSPKQERWIVANREACGAKVSIGVGISFSFVCGHVHRAPRWMQRLGFEWLHRLLQEPRRLWRRYLVDDTLFFALVVKQFFRRA